MCFTGVVKELPNSPLTTLKQVASSGAESLPAKKINKTCFAGTPLSIASVKNFQTLQSDRLENVKFFLSLLMEPSRQKSGRLALNVITMGNHNQLTTLLDHQSKIGPLIHVNQTSLRTEENNTILQLGTNSIEFLSILRMWSFWMVYPLQLVMPKH